MGKRRKNPVTDAQILEAYEISRSAYKVAAVLGVGESTVYRVLHDHQVNRTGLDDYRASIMRFKGQEQQIREWYDAGETLDMIRERLGGASDYSIKHAIRRAGGTLRINPAPTIKEGELARIQELHASGLGQMDISLLMDRSQSFVSRVMRNNNIAPHRSSGPSHSQWKGGRIIIEGGYVRVWLDASDPMASMRDRSGYVLEHRLAIARQLGRPLLPTETVHHKDGNRSNNAPENLQLRHGRHGKGAALCCLDCGSRNIGSIAITED